MVTVGNAEVLLCYFLQLLDHVAFWLLIIFLAEILSSGMGVFGGRY